MRKNVSARLFLRISSGLDEKEDEDKTSFITTFGVFCFVRMPEGLRNAGLTFNRMVKIVLGPQLRRNVSAYVDDVVIHRKKKEDHIEDPRETFANLRKYDLMLNPEKCIFGVSKGNLLGCMVSKSGIQANPEKIEAIRNMRTSKIKRHIHKLIGRIATLGRFISRLAEKSLPFFKLLSAKNKIVWGIEEEKVFKQFKDYSENLVVLTSPRDKAKLLLYIAASASAISATLVEENYEEGNLKQVPVYFVSEALAGAKKFYSELENMTCAVVMVVRKLKHYFQSYSITIPTSYPLREILENKESSARIGKWDTQLSQYAVDFTARTTIKSQVLADFIVDWTPNVNEEENDERAEKPWKMYCDGPKCGRI
jgi:hypothetical protein